MVVTAGEKSGGRKRKAGALSRTALLVAALAAVTLPPVGAFAAAPTPAVLSAQDKAELQQIAAALNAIHTMTARFEQVSSDGRTAGGWLWLDRPGRMRFEYDPPSPILLIANRFYIYYIDKALAQVSQVGLQSTPAWFLLRDPIRFDDKLVITRFASSPYWLQVTVVERKHPDLGSLTMTFSRTPLMLRQWTIVDPEGRTTTVSLSQEQFGMALNPDLFQYRNPYTGRTTEP
jgi:outer membrane lipoprotein-sorting protein